MSEFLVKNVNVFGDSVMAAKDKDGIIWVGIRWICQSMGMTEGQMKRQIKNIQKDLLLKSSGANLNLNKGSGEREVFCIKNDYLPIWLAKISITPTIQKEHPELAKKLLEYQLKAKDILAEAFFPKKTMPMTLPEQIQLLAQGTVELSKRVDNIQTGMNGLQEELQNIKLDLPILPVEADRITTTVRQKGTQVLGGKHSNAYRNAGLRQRVYVNIYSNLKYNFNVSSYKQLKRSECDKAVKIVNNYKPPLFLQDEIAMENGQQTLDL